MSRSIHALIRILVVTAFSAAGFAAAVEKKQPNILFIFADDHAYQAVSAYGDSRKLVATPNIDRIGREGMIFNRCLVPNSICGPSRACVLTGKYNHINGFLNNSNCRFDSSQPTFPKMLRAAGYQTAMIGKWHLETDPTGFDFWRILPGQGAYYNPEFIENGTHVKDVGYVTDIIGDQSIKWLKNRDRSKPFLLMCQHKAPHRSWEPPLRFLNHDAGRKYDEPSSLFDDYSNRGLAVRDQDMTFEKTFLPHDAKLTVPRGMNDDQRKEWNAYYEPRNEEFKKQNLTGRALVSWRYQRFMHDYTACVKAVDENVGRLLKFLDDEGLAENTIVVYSSDQGFYLGEHGWFDKRWVFEESLRMPLLVRWPAAVKAGTSFSGIVSNIDFAETFLDACGLPVPPDMQGRSLVPVLKGQNPAEWRKSFYYHYYEYPQPHHVRPHYGVVTDRYKLVHYYTPDVDYWELYDREKDPEEMRSFYGVAEYAAITAELMAEVGRLRKELKVPEKDEPWFYGGKRSPDARKGDVKTKP